MREGKPKLATKATSILQMKQTLSSQGIASQSRQGSWEREEAEEEPGRVDGLPEPMHRISGVAPRL